MSKELILVAAIGAAVLMVVSKQAKASAPAMTAAQLQAKGFMYTPEQQRTANVNGDMWARLLGNGWEYLSSAQNADGSPAFLKNSFGQVTTTDGKPVNGGDPIAAFQQVAAGLPQGSFGTDYLGMISPFDSLLDGGGERLGW